MLGGLDNTRGLRHTARRIGAFTADIENEIRSVNKNL